MAAAALTASLPSEIPRFDALPVMDGSLDPGITCDDSTMAAKFDNVAEGLSQTSLRSWSSDLAE